jgi:hypothetical protein
MAELVSSESEMPLVVPQDQECRYRFDPVDLDLMRLRASLTPGQRIRSMLDARELVVGLMRGRLQRHYPELSLREINLRLLKEVERVRRAAPGP